MGKEPTLIEPIPGSTVLALSGTNSLMKRKKAEKNPLKPLSCDPKHALNAICPYYTMFPLEYPFSILKKYRKRPIRLLDPFCGRGTSIYAGRMNKHDSFG